MQGRRKSKRARQGPWGPGGTPPDPLTFWKLLYCCCFRKKRKKAPKRKASLHFHILSCSQKLPDSWKTACLSSHQQMSTEPKGKSAVPGPGATDVPRRGAQPFQGPHVYEEGPSEYAGGQER